MHCQGQGFYLGLALWPGGTAEDWQPAYDASKGVYGLNPCNVTGSYNGTGHTHRAYLVPRFIGRGRLTGSASFKSTSLRAFPLHRGAAHWHRSQHTASDCHVCNALRATSRPSHRAPAPDELANCRMRRVWCSLPSSCAWTC